MKIKTANKSNEPTLIGTAVGLLQERVAVHVSEAFRLVPAVDALDMEEEPTTFPAGTLPSNIWQILSLILYHKLKQPMYSTALGQVG